MKTTISICLLLMAQVANGEVLLITDAGAWISSVDSAGVPSWTQVGTAAITVIDERGETPTNPNPNPKPPVDSLATRVEAWTRAIRPADTTTTLGMAEVYKIGAEQSRSGMADDQAVKLVSMLSDEVLKEQKASLAWQPWRDNVSTAVDETFQRGEFGPETLDSIERGLRASTKDQAINPDNLQKLLEFILKILPLILRILGL